MFGSLLALRERPLPARESLRPIPRDYRDWPIDQTAPTFAELLVPAADFGVAGRNHYAHDRNPPYWQKADGAIDALFVRRGVAERLAAVDSRLKESGLRLFLYDAWRPRAVQAYFHDVWMPREVRKRMPHLDDAAVLAEVERYWAAPSDGLLRPAPHATGGAVDLSIVADDGQPLYMGSVFDDVTALAHLDRFEKNDAADFSFSHDEARANRRLLFWLMTEAGFSGHPNEWWHYSYGDQMWAAKTGVASALYGLAEPSAELLAR
jgi:D-alanyl-D-alanine dipeptidase